MGAVVLITAVAVIAIVVAWIWLLSWCGFFDRAPDDEEQDR